MTEKGFFRENAVPMAFTIAVIIAGTVLLLQQDYFNSEMSSSAVFESMQLKVFLEEDEAAFIAYVPSDYLMSVGAFAGDYSPVAGSMVLGFDEAGVMAEEKNLTASQILWGYEIEEEFLGTPSKITGTLKKTGTILDMMHIVSKTDFDRAKGQKIDIKLTEEGMPKFFYYINTDGSNWPGVTFAEGSREGFSAISENGKRYLPLVIGSEEAEMMRSEKLFSKIGERIDEFFGKNVYITGILAPTNSSLDMLHYTLAS